MTLINFKRRYTELVEKLERKSKEICQKLRDKLPTLSKAEYKDLYNDMIRVIEAGMITKEFGEILQQNLMNAENQFTREVFEQKV